MVLTPLEINADHLEREPQALTAVFNEVKARLALFPPLNEILLSESDEELCTLLDEREAALGMATLPRKSLLLLKKLLEDKGLVMASQIHGPHRPTFHAWEKQKLLPWGSYVQKTTTLRLGGKLLLICSVGDRRLGRSEKSALTSHLALSPKASRQVKLNPSTVEAESLGFLRGIVSPFLSEGHWNDLHALVQLAWPPEWEQQHVAISLSPCESLLIPLRFYGGILCRYVPKTMPIYFLDQSGVTVTSGRREEA